MSTVTLTMPDGEARKPYEFRQVLKGTGPFKIIAALLPDGLKAQITGSTLVVYGTLPQGTNVFPVTVEVGNCCGQNTTFISSLAFTDDCPVVEDCGACSFTFSATNTLITTAGVSHHLEVHGTPGATFTLDVVGSFTINGKEYRADNHRAESIPVGGVWTYDTAPSKAGDQAFFSFSITPTGRYRGQTVCGGPFYVTTSVPVVPAGCDLQFTVSNTSITTAGVSHILSVAGSPGATFNLDIVGTINGLQIDSHQPQTSPWTFTTAPSQPGDVADYRFSITPTGSSVGKVVCGGPFRVQVNVPRDPTQTECNIGLSVSAVSTTCSGVGTPGVVVQSANYALTVGGAFIPMTHSGNVYTAACTGGAVKELEFLTALSSGAVFPAGTVVTMDVWSGPTGSGTKTSTTLSGYSPAGQPNLRLAAQYGPSHPTVPCGGSIRIEIQVPGVGTSIFYINV